MRDEGRGDEARGKEKKKENNRRDYYASRRGRRRRRGESFCRSIAPAPRPFLDADDTDSSYLLSFPLTRISR